MKWNFILLPMRSQIQKTFSSPNPLLCLIITEVNIQLIPMQRCWTNSYSWKFLSSKMPLRNALEKDMRTWLLNSTRTSNHPELDTCDFRLSRILWMKKDPKPGNARGYAHVTCTVDTKWMNFIFFIDIRYTDILWYTHIGYFSLSWGKLYAIYSFNLKVLALALQEQERHHRLVFLSRWTCVWYNTKKPALLHVNTCWSFQKSTDFLGVYSVQ